MAERRIKPDEAALWDAITEDIKPLGPNRRKRVIEEAVADSAPAATRKQGKAKASIKVSDKISARPLASPNPDANVDKRTLGRLKKGKMEIASRLDLHGHTQASAHRALDAFIEAAYENQRRCVLVITGKGLRASDGNRGVLRQAVPQWLSSSKLSEMIVSWQPAQPRDGGDGALYVLIRRKR